MRKSTYYTKNSRT